MKSKITRLLPFFLFSALTAEADVDKKILKPKEAEKKY